MSACLLSCLGLTLLQLLYMVLLLNSWFTNSHVVLVSPFPEAKVMRLWGFDQNLPAAVDPGLAISSA